MTHSDYYSKYFKTGGELDQALLDATKAHLYADQAAASIAKTLQNAEKAAESERNAANSENVAQASAVQAAKDAAAALKSATDADASQKQAAGDASNANTSAAQAKQSENQSAASAAHAKTSETNAAQSAAASEASAQRAQRSAEVSAVSETNVLANAKRAEKAARDAMTFAQNAPTPDGNTWWVYSPETKQYEDSGKPYQGPAGPKGDRGQNFAVLGYYATLAALQVAVPSPAIGDAYGVGAAAPYHIYIYGPAGWVDNGKMQGPAGKSAYQAAADGGFTGTEAQFNAALKAASTLPNSLTIGGMRLRWEAASQSLFFEAVT